MLVDIIKAIDECTVRTFIDRPVKRAIDHIVEYIQEKGLQYPGNMLLKKHEKYILPPGLDRKELSLKLTHASVKLTVYFPLFEIGLNCCESINKLCTTTNSDYFFDLNKLGIILSYFGKSIKTLIKYGTANLITYAEHLFQKHLPPQASQGAIQQNPYEHILNGLITLRPYLLVADTALCYAAINERERWSLITAAVLPAIFSLYVMDDTKYPSLFENFTNKIRSAFYNPMPAHNIQYIKNSNPQKIFKT